MQLWKNKIPVFYFDCGSNFEARSLYDFDDFYSFQEDVVKNYHCDYIQGYLYSKPINGEEIEKWMKERIA